VARSVERALAARGLENPREDEGAYHFRCTGDVAAFQALGTRFLQMPLGEVVHVELGAAMAAARPLNPGPAMVSLDGGRRRG
jgi:glutamate racemase